MASMTPDDSRINPMPASSMPPQIHNDDHENENEDEASFTALDDVSLNVTSTEESEPHKSLTDPNLNGFQNPFLGVPQGSLCDPASENFSAKAWISNLAGFISKEPQRYLVRTLGVSFRHLNVSGFGTPTDYQKTVGNIPLELGVIFRWLMGTRKHQIQILKDFNGVIRSGEMLLVLGRPGSGCSTLLKSLSGDNHGLVVDARSNINYQGIPADQMHKQFRGESIYMAETDVHFPHLTVGQTLLFAAKARFVSPMCLLQRT